MSLNPQLLLALWFAPLALQFAIAIVMLVRKTFRELPIFFTYTVFEVAAALLLKEFKIDHRISYSFFFTSYWISEAISIFLGFLVISEIFSKVFQTYDALRSLSSLLFRWAILVLIFLAIGTAAAVPSGEASTLIATILGVERSLRFVQVGLISFLFLFSSYFKVQWQDVVFGIALGFGLYASTDLVLAAARSHFGTSALEVYELAKPLAYNCAAFVWAVYIIRRPAPVRNVETLPATELDRWNHALAEMLQQ